MQEKKLDGLTVRRARINKINLIIASGKCDICSVQLLKDKMTEVIDEGNKKLIVDVRNMCLDSSALAAILWAKHKIEENGGRLVLVGAGDKYTLLRSIGGLLSIASTIGEALSVLSKIKVAA